MKNYQYKVTITTNPNTSPEELTFYTNYHRLQTQRDEVSGDTWLIFDSGKVRDHLAQSVQIIDNPSYVPDNS